MPQLNLYDPLINDMLQDATDLVKDQFEDDIPQWFIDKYSPMCQKMIDTALENEDEIYGTTILYTIKATRWYRAYKADKGTPVVTLATTIPAMENLIKWSQKE